MYKKKLLLSLIFIITFSHWVPTSFAIVDSLGTEFYLLFETNAIPPDSLELIITAVDNDAEGNIEIPSLAFSIPFSVTRGSFSTLSLPVDLHDLGNDTIRDDKGIHVVSDEAVIVQGLNRSESSSDGFLVLPVTQLGFEYLVVSSYGGNPVNKSQFAIIATQDGTQLSFTPSIDVGAYDANIPYAITLNKLETFQLQADGDLSGTEIIADKPIAVFAGNECDNIPGSYQYCSHLVEQLFPVPAWGTSFITYPLATRTGGDTIRILAAEDNTFLSYNPPQTGAPSSLNKGGYFDITVSSGLSITAAADKPIMVAQYSHGSSYDGALADSFMMLIRSTENVANGYRFVSPTGFLTHYMNIIVPDIAREDVVLDGVPVASGLFSQIGSSSYYGAALELFTGAGPHYVSCTLPIGVQVYGFANENAYGYPGGSTFEIAEDGDGDGVLNPLDLCPDTPEGLIVKTNGCLEGDYDNDGDVDGVDLQQFSNIFGISP